MMLEPETKRTICFFDGQNLFHHAKDAFGCTYPDYSPLALASCICRTRGFNLHQIRFYTGVPTKHDDAFWNAFWSAKLLAMSRMGIFTFSRQLRYRRRTFQISDGVEFSRDVGEEKGIDVRIAIDVIRLVRMGELDVALLFSQDNDFSEVADEIVAIADEQKRWIKIASAFPASPTASNRRGINKTDWIPIDRATYESCIDPRDYRPKHKLQP